MGRPIRYANADNLLANCTIKDDCFLWPRSSTPMPMLSPASPLTKQFGTSSVVRILFSICRYVPAGPRLVRRCSHRFCVNPYHYSEAKEFRARRAKLTDPHGLLPEQEGSRHLIAPPDEVLYSMRPSDPAHLKILMDSAVLAGFDAKGIINKRSYAPVPKPEPRYADPKKPVLVVRGKAKPASSPGGGSLDDIEESLGKTRDSRDFPPTQDQRDLDNIFSLIHQRDRLIEAGVAKSPGAEQPGN
jgi:hypothetical protein